MGLSHTYSFVCLCVFFVVVNIRARKRANLKWKDVERIKSKIEFLI